MPRRFNAGIFKICIVEWTSRHLEYVCRLLTWAQKYLVDKLKNICRSHSQPALGGSAVRERSSSAAGGGGHHGGSAPSLSQKNFKVGPTITLPWWRVALKLETKVIRRFPKISQSRRRPLLGLSPGWKCLLALLYIYDTMLNKRLNAVSRHEIGTTMLRS